MLLSIKVPTNPESCVRYNTTRLERVQMSYDSEKLVAKLFEGTTSAHRDPIDVITKTFGIEVKAFNKATQAHKIRTTAEAVKRKIEFCATNKLKQKTILAVVNDFVELYEKAGFGNFRKENMKYIGRYKKVR